MSMLVRGDDFGWQCGEAKTWSYRADSSNDKDCVFCTTCGTRIYNALSSMLATFNLKPGTLDDSS